MPALREVRRANGKRLPKALTEKRSPEEWKEQLPGLSLRANMEKRHQRKELAGGKKSEQHTGITPGRRRSAKTSPALTEKSPGEKMQKSLVGGQRRKKKDLVKNLRVNVPEWWEGLRKRLSRVIFLEGKIVV